MQQNSFVKTHGLGNEYIVLNDQNINFELTPNAIKRLCNIHYGIGSDGVLLKVAADNADFGLRIFNPDASEAEKSGNGLRIFAKYLYDYGFVKNKEFSINTLGGLVKATIIETDNEKAKLISVDIGKAIFNPSDIPVNLNKNECINENILVGDKEYKINCISVGNPHCVIVKDKLDIDEIKQYGPLLEYNKLFPNKINVQFAKVVSHDIIEIIIWERGAGYTLASGSSSSAVAAMMAKKGLTNKNVTIKMPGGELKINIDANWNIRLTGEVSEIAIGILSNELIKDFL